ncbi:MAG: molybdenum cofactor biosynthesis protein MoaE [Brachymonas sp.]
MLLDCRVQAEDFSLAAQSSALQLALGASTGAVASFVGCVRAAPGTAAQGDFLALELQHYPGMSQRCVQALGQDCAQRFALQGLCIIHRYGYLPAGEQIVLVLAAAAHRKAALQAVDYAMDQLKSAIPFWKKEHWQNSSLWVQAKAQDLAHLAAWQAVGTTDLQA